MHKLAARRAELRPRGVTNAPCHRCHFFEDCGGIETSRPLLTCFDEHCCGKEDCGWVCPNHSASFNSYYREINGFGFDDITEIRHAPINLPVYIPVVDHRSRRDRPLDWPVVALNTYRTIRPVGDRYRTVADSPEAVRAQFGLGETTRIVLRGIAKDPQLEAYWHYRRSDDAPGQLARLGACLAIAPNFSLFLNVPRTEHLFNRKRQLICLDEMHRAGLCAVPHLSAVYPGDWRFWRRFLEQNPGILFVAKEFETGNRDRSEGVKVLRELGKLQEGLGRKLHLIAIGAAQLIGILPDYFETFTVMDSTPFIKAMFRKGFDEGTADGSWYDSFSLDRQAIDALLLKNLCGYSDWLERQAAVSRTRPGVSREPAAASSRVPGLSEDAESQAARSNQPTALLVAAG